MKRAAYSATHSSNVTHNTISIDNVMNQSDKPLESDGSDSGSDNEGDTTLDNEIEKEKQLEIASNVKPIPFEIDPQALLDLKQTVAKLSLNPIKR